MKNMLDEQEASNELKPVSMRRKRLTAELISKTSFASKRIQNISADEIKKELNKFAQLRKLNGEFKYSQSYINKIFSVTRQVFSYAVDNDILLLEKSPFKTKTKVKKPKASKKTKKVTPLDLEETKLFLKQLSIETDKYRDELMFVTTTGARPGEALAIKSKNCFLDEGIIKIEVSLTKDRRR